MTKSHELPEQTVGLPPILPVTEAVSDNPASAGAVDIIGFSDPKGAELLTPRATGTYADNPDQAPFYMRPALNGKGLIPPGAKRNNNY